MKLTDTQSFVLSAAADHPEYRVEQFPENVNGGARAKVLAGLSARGLIRQEGEHPVLSDEGFRAIGRERPATVTTDFEAEVAAAETAWGKPDAKPRRTREGSKQSRIIEALNAPGGITLAGLIALTGWQAHSVRGVLANLKRAGVPVTSTKEGNERVYRLA